MSFLKRLKFSDKEENQRAIKIRKWHNVAYYDTLCRYCADNDIDVNQISDEEFMSASEVMARHGQKNKKVDHYYFWIDVN